MSFLVKMGFAVVGWKSKNGVPIELGKVEYEALSLAKVVVMNGKEKEVGAEVSMMFQKILWGGTIHSLHGM